MVKRRLFSSVGRGFLAALVFLPACGTFDRVDESADKAVARVEVAADRALDAAASRASVLVAESVTRAEEASGRLLDRAAATLLTVVEKLPAALAAGVKAQTDAASSRAADKAASVLPAADREAFKRDVEEFGLLKALRDWWLEIVLSFFGAGGAFKAWLLSRRVRNESALSTATVSAIEEAESEELKRRVAEKSKSLRPDIREFVNRRVQEIVERSVKGRR